MFEFLKPKRADIIANSKPDHLYCHEADKVKFYSIVSQNETETVYKVSTRTQLRVVQNLKNGQLESLELTKVVGTEERQRITIPKFTLERLHAFLALLADLDLANHDARRAIIVDNQLSDLDAATRESMIDMLSGLKGSELVTELMDSGALNERDIVNTGYRRQQLELFYDLLYNNYLGLYKADVMDKPDTKDETAWQHFFEHNEWIFGYGLSYRFNTILQREFSASDTQADGTGQVNTDFLTADRRFTAFVELKKPDTALFGGKKNRSGAWKLSTDLMEVHSQALQQKAAGTMKLEKGGRLTDNNGRYITQRALDAQMTVVIGSWTELEQDSDHLRDVKQQTFELFRRDSRNVEYITYDELYERARQIVEHGTPSEAVAA